MPITDKQTMLSKLDEVAAIRALDSQDQFGMVAGLPGQLFDAYEAGGRVALEGRRLDVDGVQYFVITSFAAGNS